MLHTPPLNPKHSQVTVRFDDGAHFFRLRDGATLAELAERVCDLGALHVSVPIAIDVDFQPQAKRGLPSHGCNFRTHRNLNQGMNAMDKDRIKGAAEKFKGSIKKSVGKLIGNKKLETDGKIDVATGNVREAVGEAKDVVREAVKDRTK